MQEGYDGLLRNKTRPSRIQPLGSTITERVGMLTQTDPPAEATHWTSAMMAKVVDIQRIWRAHGLRPHQMKQFKLRVVAQCRGGLLRQTHGSDSGNNCFSPATPCQSLPRALVNTSPGGEIICVGADGFRW